MSWENINSRTVITRKPHKCLACWEVFPKGTEMKYTFGKYDGDISSYYLCECCNAFMNQSIDDFEKGFGPGEFRGEEEYIKFKNAYYGVQNISNGVRKPTGDNICSERAI